MTRKLLAILLIISFGILLASCEVPAPGTPLPTVTSVPTETPVPPTDTLLPPTDTPVPPTDTPAAPAVETTAPPEPNALWPPRPEDFASYVTTILDFLNAAPVHIVRLRPMLREWGTITDNMGSVTEADIDGDGELEWIVVIADSTAQTVTVPSDLVVIARQENTYSVLYQLTTAFESHPENVAVLSIGDINADGKVELSYTTTICGAHTCFTSVYILAWDGDTFKSLTRDQIVMPYSQVSLRNYDDDAALELILHGGMIGSVGAGPQRARTEVYNWDGTYYVPTETIYDESDFLYFKVLDANVALMAGDYTRAIALYQEAISNPDLRVWKDEKERADLAAFSRFRLMLTYVLVKDETNAEAMAETLQSEQPDHIYTQVAQVFLDYYTKQNSITAACQAVKEFAYEHPETVDVLMDFGYTNPSFSPDEVCPIGLSASGP